MSEDIQKCTNKLCEHRAKCLRYSDTAPTSMFVPIGKAGKTLPAQRICGMYLPKPTE